MKTINLFCLSFAGGNKYSYRQFAEKAPPFLNLINLEYPGRGSRIGESLVSDMTELVDDLYIKVKDLIGKKKYALYGHSMGGVVAYLLAVKLLENGFPAPEHLFISGTSGPSSLTRAEKQRHLLNKEDFIEMLREFGGMPDEILNEPNMLDFLEPILRNDFTATETYLYKPTPPINVPFTVMKGKEEDLEISEVELWQNETGHKLDIMELDGDHFFIFQHPEFIMNLISEKLSNIN